MQTRSGMVFGDGDGAICGRMTSSLDVIGHELAHGVTEDEAGLEYFGKSGALNESLSDVFGSLIEQHRRNQKADEADWLIGNEVWTPQIQGDALRSMKAPGTAYDDPLIGKDPQPAHMRDYVDTTKDNGGVHINSGIPNHAFSAITARVAERIYGTGSAEIKAVHDGWDQVGVATPKP
jgi:Zn-dependent metalloprotease